MLSFVIGEIWDIVSGTYLASRYREYAHYAEENEYFSRGFSSTAGWHACHAAGITRFAAIWCPAFNAANRRFISLRVGRALLERRNSICCHHFPPPWFHAILLPELLYFHYNYYSKSSLESSQIRIISWLSWHLTPWRLLFPFRNYFAGAIVGLKRLCVDVLALSYQNA